METVDERAWQAGAAVQRVAVCAPGSDDWA